MNGSRLLALLLPAVLTACAGPSALQDKWTTQVVVDDKRGEKPVHYEKAIRAYLDRTLKDPFSMQIQNITEPVEGMQKLTQVVQAPTLINVNGRVLETHKLGWLVKAEVNAKNSYGGYVGWKPYAFVFRGEEIIFVDN